MNKLPITRITVLIKDPLFWGSFLFIGLSMLVLGWANSYPVQASSTESTVYDSVSILYWIGLVLGFVALSGLAISSKSPYIHWGCSCLFVLLFSSPQFLFISFGSDAGVLARYTNYTYQFVEFNLAEIETVISYFQWPVSIFFHRFITDMSGVDTNASAILIFILAMVSIVSSVFTLWYDSQHARFIFWGVVANFAGFFWFLNWQAVPYVFSLVFLVPTISLLEQRSVQSKILLLLLAMVGFETHALIGVWLILLVMIYFISTQKTPNQSYKFSLVVLLLVAQTAIIIYKNQKFFKYIVDSLQGYYLALLETGTTDKTIAEWTRQAITSTASTPLDQLFKILSWFDVFVFALVFALAGGYIILTRRLKPRELGLILVALIYFVIGTMYASIGTRAFQLLALAASFFVVDSLSNWTTLRPVLLAGMVVGLLLLPAPMLRSLQSSNFVEPGDLFLASYFERIADKHSWEISLLTEHVRPLPVQNRFHLISTRLIRNKYQYTCEGPVLVADTLSLRSDLRDLGIDSSLLDNKLVFYDSGSVKLVFLEECGMLGLSAK